MFYQNPTCSSLDSDSDGILNDGDNSGVVGDHPCSGGNIFNCDDNCLNISNSDQADCSVNYFSRYFDTGV